MKTTWLLLVGLLSYPGCNAGDEKASVAGRPPGVAGCEVIVPDEEVHCPYHSAGIERNDLLYVDLHDGTVRAASVERTECELDANLRCRDAGLLLAAEHVPPEGTPLPTFIPLASGELVIVCTREWSVTGGVAQRDLIRVDFLTSADARVPLAFARHALGGQAIYRR